jgi:cell pole-organizing protein PopZ
MSKPESTGAKSLEEILASIRKSLADEAPPEPRTPSLKAAQPQLKPLTPDIGGPAQPASAPAKGGGVLSAKLAGAANGAGRGPSLDPDLSELLAGEPKKSASPFLAEPGKPAGAKAPADDDKDKDPLWFLSRLSAAAAGPAGEGSAARARDAAKAPTTPAEEIKLSRPETLRASLPPLFDTTAEPAATVARSEKTDKIDKADAASGLTARTKPRVLTPLLDPTPSPTPAKDAPEPIKSLGKAEPSTPTFFGSTPAAIRDEPAAFKSSPGPMPAADKPTLAGLIPSAPPVEAKPLADPLSELRPGASPESAPAATGDALPTRALEQMVAELLEPVIRQWLNNNLPRLIEKAVREEVARVVAAEREAKKA